MRGLANECGLCIWTNDSFGNRTAQVLQTASCPTPTSGTPLTPTVNYNSNNQVTFVANVAPAGYAYDHGGQRSER